MIDEHALVRLMGWRATILHGDPTVFDRWRWVRRHLRRGRLRTLDAGCASGAFTMYAARIGNEALGISFNARDLRAARERAFLARARSARFVDADLRHLDSISERLGTFDQILFLETIEHVFDDVKLVGDLAALLRPGGRILVTTPFKGHKPMWGERLSEEEDGGHVRWGYTHEDLREILEGHGLDIVREDFLSGVVSQKLASLTWRLQPVSRVAAWALTLPLRLLQVLDRPITRLLREPYLTVAVVARKPGRPS